MGQSACGHQIDPQSKQSNSVPYNDFQIPVDEEGDNPSKEILKKKFLQTKVIASWNILKEKSNNLEELRHIFKEITYSTTKKVGILKTSDSSNDNQNAEQRSNTQIIKTLGKNKLRQRMHSEYQNIQIQVGSFIKIRTENIFEFYEFKEKIGQGTFGHVFRAIQKRTGEVRAIKGLKKQMMNNVSKMSFIAQIDLLKRLDHPNIIKLYDLFLYEGVYYVITQLCEGGSVQKYFSKHKNEISQEKVRILMKQLFSTLSYLYNCSVVHRDLKLQNLVFLKNPSLQGNENLEIKLIDFGTAVTVQKHKKNQTGLVGTLYYIAPEFTKGFYTQKCDIWSAGVIFFQLLFGEYPFRGKNQSQILHEITTKNIDWRRLYKKKISKQAFELVQNMLDKNYLTRASAKTLIQNEWIRGASVARASKELQQSVSSSLAKYNRKNNFVSLIESFLAFKKVSQLQRQQLSRLFCQIDNDNSGIIEVDELITFYKNHFTQIDEDDIKAIVANVDKNNSGKIDFNEFLTAVAKKNEIFAQGALKQAFQYVDKDKTGFITRKQLKDLLKTADKRETDEVFMNLDENGDNQISFEQFKSYLINYK